MKANLTEIVFIIDKSGSMGRLRQDTIGSFNSMLAQQKEEKGEALVTTMFFSDSEHIVHDRIAIGQIPELTKQDYTPMGCTALYDAIGFAIDHIGHIHKYARHEDCPEQTIFIIITDGMENASHRYTGDRVRKMVEHQKRKHHWEFLFLGANIDAVAAAESVGIQKENAVNWTADSEGSAAVFRAVGTAVSCARACAPRPQHWREELDEMQRKNFITSAIKCR